MEKKEFFQENQSPFERSLMELVLSGKKGIDRIFEVHIMLEYLFCTGHSHELSFRIPLNGAFFISNNFTEFEVNYKFFREFYKIRSSAIHGSDLEMKIEKSIKKLKKLDIKIYSFEHLIDILEDKIRKIILKLLDYENNFPELINQFNKDSLFFIRDKKEILGY